MQRVTNKIVEVGPKISGHSNQLYYNDDCDILLNDPNTLNDHHIFLKLKIKINTTQNT